MHVGYFYIGLAFVMSATNFKSSNIGTHWSYADFVADTCTEYGHLLLNHRRQNHSLKNMSKVSRKAQNTRAIDEPTSESRAR